MRTSRAIEFLLSVLQHGTETSISLIGMFAMSKGELMRSVHRQDTGFHFDADWPAAYRDRQKFHNLLQHLKREGFIEQKHARWGITASGRLRLGAVREQNRWSASSARYANGGADTTLKIIIYDIPSTREGQKQRQWLRSALKNLEFTLLQKSVWVGKRKVPEQFLKDLRERNLIPAVQILAVTKSGTLRSLE